MADDVDAEHARDEAERLEHFHQWRDGGYNIMGVDTSGPVVWVPGAERIIRRGERQCWVAREGGGKTQAALHLAAQVCEAGGRVIYVDVENDRQEMAERVQPIAEAWGATAAVNERLAYLPDLSFPKLREDGDLLYSFVGAVRQVDLLVMDSWTRVLNSFGLEEDSNRDIARFMEEFVDPLARHGVTVLILDNTGKKGEDARGAVSKRALVESVYNVSGGKTVKPDRHGKLELKLDRSRSGKLADYVTAGSGGGDYERLTAQVGDAPVKRDADVTARHSLLRARFHDHPDEVYDRDALATLTGASRSSITTDLQALRDEEWIVKAKGPDGDRKQYWRFNAVVS